MLTEHPETIQRCCLWCSISDIGVRMQAHASGHRDGLGRATMLSVLLFPTLPGMRC
jgi:hypothetical protein